MIHMTETEKLPASTIEFEWVPSSTMITQLQIPKASMIG